MLSRGLSLSRLVSVQVILSRSAAAVPIINSACFVGPSDVIDTFQRMRSYDTLPEVGLDFATTTPEYQAAAAWFGQSPQPNSLNIGRWAQTATHAHLVGGAVSAANQTITNWTSITNGAFFVTIDGIPRAVTGLNFSTASNLNGVASTIQAALVGLGVTGASVLWNSNYQTFEISSGSTGTSSTISYASAPTAFGSFTFSAQPAANATITLNGTVVTFVAAAPTGNQVLIGATLAATLVNAVAFLNSSTDTNISLMSYSANATTLFAVSKLTGTAGDVYTLAASTSPLSNATTSGATLSGGAGTDISAMMAIAAGSSGAYVAQGTAAESALSAIELIDSMYGTQFYGVVALGVADSDHEAIAAYIEADSPVHYYGVTTQEAGAMVATDVVNIAYNLANAKYNKTAVQYSSTSPYAICSYLGRILPTDWTGQNTAITLMHKNEPGITPENITSTQANALESNNCNVLVEYQNGVGIIEYGTSASGQFTDIVIGADALAIDAQTAVFNKMLGATTKIPYTDPGITTLLNTAESSCTRFVRNGFLAPGIWDQAPIGAINTGDLLPKGFYAFAGPVATVAQATRGQRAGPPIQLACKAASAVHTESIIITIDQ